mgnify:FL=1
MVLKINQNAKNVLIIGSGSIANQHIKNLIKLKINVLVIIKDQNEKKRFDRNTIKKIEFIDDISKLKKPIFFGIIASSTYKHFEHIKILVDKKINIFCEKPISNNLIEMKSLRKKIKSKKIFFYVNYQLQNHHLISQLIKRIKNKKIHFIKVRVGHNLKFWRKNKIRQNSYFINTKKGGGVIYELIHEINLINNIFGKIIKIKTLKKNITSDYDKYEDLAISLFETNKKIVGTLFQDMVSKNKVRYIKVFMNNDIIKIDFIKNKIFEIKNKKTLIIKNKFLDLQKDLIKKNIENFINIINSKKFSIKFFDEAVYDLKICKMMHEKF